MKISNNPDIFKLSFIKKNSFNLISNDNQTNSYNFMDENSQIQNNNIPENSNNLDENNFQKCLRDYESQEETESNVNHFVFIGESYNKNNIIDDSVDDKENNKKKINNNINNDIKNNKIKEKKEKRDFLTDEEIEKTCLIQSKAHYALFQNYGENSCYVNVILHFLYSSKIIFEYLVNIYKTRINKNKNNIDKKLNLNKSKEKTEKQMKEEKEMEAQEDLMSSLGEILYKYQKALNSKHRVNILSTFEFRKKLSKFSNRFLLNYVADPVEFLDFLLEILIKMDENKIRNNFYLNIKEEYVCDICKNKTDFNYNNKTFIHTIYIEDIINYLSKHKIKLEDYSNKLFLYSQLNYLNTEKKCENKHPTNKKFICKNNPNYLIINCVWTKYPNIEQVLKLFTLIGLKNKLNDLFEIPPQKNINPKDLNYDLTHIILYSFALFHYIIITYNPKLNIFNLYDDSKVVECDSFPEIVEMITANLITQNPYYYFYPVLLIYSKYDLYKDENLINGNKIDKKLYDSLVENCKKSIKAFEKELKKKEKSPEKKNNNKKNDNNINNNSNKDKNKQKNDNNKEQKPNQKIENNTKNEKNKKIEEDIKKNKEILIDNKNNDKNSNNKEKEPNSLLNNQNEIDNKKKLIEEDNKTKKVESKNESNQESKETNKNETKKGNKNQIKKEKIKENDIKNSNDKNYNELTNNENINKESIKQKKEKEILTNNFLNNNINEIKKEINPEEFLNSNDNFHIYEIKIRKRKKENSN